MTALAIQVTGARDWNPVASPKRSEVLVEYECPKCTKELSMHLQPLPWHKAQRPREDNETSVPHDEVDKIETQLWCHVCGHGAAITLREA